MIRWRTVSYHTLIFWSTTGLVLVIVVILVFFPGWRAALAEFFIGSSRGNESALAELGARQARFTNIDGGVRIRKANQVVWVSADFSISLDKGDMIQTSNDGVARVAFADGTLYVVKPDTLIVIEENAIPQDRAASRVTVQVSSGEVDLSTSHEAGQTRVMFADAEAQIRRQSRALVSNNPETNTRQITVSRGGAELRRGGEQVELAEYEQATFAGPDSPTVKKKIVAPPILLTPPNMAPVVIRDAKTTEVEFTWTPVPGADSYRLRVSSSPILATTHYDRRVQTTSVRLPSFAEGNYYWAVTSIDARRNESQPSEPNQFSVVRQQNEGEILLIVERYIQHGKVIEIVGRTEPGATVLVNNQPVFNVAPDGSFKHFTPPLPNTGPNQITITAQNSAGKIATLRKTIVVE
ncbi:MAG: FecR domain-containing protein [Acidobacteria bacterium]|nr:FecR domain-containing protein [Acidobacteriota bacterium]